MKYLALLTLPVILLSGCATQQEESDEPEGYYHKPMGRQGHFHFTANDRITPTVLSSLKTS